MADKAPYKERPIPTSQFHLNKRNERSSIRNLELSIYGGLIHGARTEENLTIFIRISNKVDQYKPLRTARTDNNHYSLL